MSIIELGESIPALTPHVSLFLIHDTKQSMLTLREAASVSLPTWRDNIEYEEGQERVLSKMITGYPRYGYYSSEIDLTH
jgi:cystathionine gamma-synthase